MLVSAAITQASLLIQSGLLLRIFGQSVIKAAWLFGSQCMCVQTTKNPRNQTMIIKNKVERSSKILAQQFSNANTGFLNANPCQQGLCLGPLNIQLVLTQKNENPNNQKSEELSESRSFSVAQDFCKLNPNSWAQGKLKLMKPKQPKSISGKLRQPQTQKRSG